MGGLRLHFSQPCLLALAAASTDPPLPLFFCYSTKAAILSKWSLDGMDRFLLSVGEKGKTWNFEVRSPGGRRKRTLVKISESAKGKSEFRVPTWNLEVPEEDLLTRTAVRYDLFMGCDAME